MIRRHLIEHRRTWVAVGVLWAWLGLCFLVGGVEATASIVTLGVFLSFAWLVMRLVWPVADRLVRSRAAGRPE